MNYYYWTIPATFLCYCVSAYISHKTNTEYSHKWFALNMIWGNVGIFLWCIVAKITNNIVFDGMLFDVIMTLGFVFALILLGAGDGFSTMQWIGCIVVLLGVILMKI